MGKSESRSRPEVTPAHLVNRECVPNLIPLWTMVILVDELFQHSPSNARSVQPNMLSGSFEVHDLEFAGGITVIGCGNREG